MSDNNCTVTRPEIIAAARRWLGVPWKHQGRNRFGVDCAGLLVLVSKELGLTDYDTKGYARLPTQQSLPDNFRHAGAFRISPSIMLDGDMIMFKEARYPCHVGFVSTKHNRRHVIHAAARARCVVEEEFEGELSTKIVMAFRFPGVV